MECSSEREKTALVVPRKGHPGYKEALERLLRLGAQGGAGKRLINSSVRPHTFVLQVWSSFSKF